MNLYENYEQTRFTWDHRRAAVWREIIRLLERRLGVPNAFLELGAGYCDAINSSLAPSRVAIDIRPEFRSHAAPGVLAKVSRCDDLSWVADGSIDWVLASNLFEHLTRQTLVSTLAQVRRLLSPAGMLIIIQPNFRLCCRDYFDDFTHLPEAVMTDRSMPDFLATQEYIPSLVIPRFLPFSLKSRLPVHRLLIRAYLHSPIRPFAGQMLVVALPRRR